LRHVYGCTRRKSAKITSCRHIESSEPLCWRSGFFFQAEDGIRDDAPAGQGIARPTCRAVSVDAKYASYRPLVFARTLSWLFLASRSILPMTRPNESSGKIPRQRGHEAASLLIRHLFPAH